MRTMIRFALLTGGLAVVATAGTVAYVLNGPGWGTRTVNYYINPANNDVSEEAAEAAIQAGAATWGSQSNADFRFYYMGRTSGSNVANNGKNEVFFRDTSAGNIVAETYWWTDASRRLIDTDVVFYDGGMNFFTGSSGCSNGVYLEDTSAHEFGHALGLGHSSDPSATMYYLANWCDTSNRTLDSDDLSAVESLYPSSGGGGGGTAPSLSIDSPAENSMLLDSVPAALRASASDQQDGDLTSSIVWWSSLLPTPIGYGGYALLLLPPGDHVISATVTDSGGYTTTRNVNVRVGQSPAPDPSSEVYTLVTSPETVAPGAFVSISWTSPEGRPWEDGIALFRAGDSDTSALWWTYTYGASSGTTWVQAPTETGTYEFRYFKDGSIVSAQSTLSVKSSNNDRRRRNR
jgi:Matrixin